MRTGAKVEFRLGGRSALRVSAGVGEVHIQYKVQKAVRCPCDDVACDVSIRVGRYHLLGSGSVVCVHCGKGREDGTEYRHLRDLKSHVREFDCRIGKGQAGKRRSKTIDLGLRLRHIIKDPENYVKEEEGDKVRERFKCPKCGETRAWPKRFQHAMKCFPKHGIELPSDGEDKNGGKGEESC